jgi:hypothetical protein
MAALGYFRIGYFNIVRISTIESKSSETAGYVAANLGDQNINTSWRPSGTPPVAENVVWDAGSEWMCNIVAFFNHDLKAHSVAAVTIKVGGADNGSTFDTTLLTWNPSAEASDYNIFHTITQAGKRYWQGNVPTISGQGNPDIGEVFLGRLIDFPVSYPLIRTDDYGVDIIDVGAGYSTAEQYGAKREIIAFRAEGLTDAEMAAVQAAEVSYQNGLNLCLLLDTDTELAKGVAKIGRFLNPLSFNHDFVDSNSFERIWRQEL